jgi:hypothetical protein
MARYAVKNDYFLIMNSGISIHASGIKSLCRGQIDNHCTNECEVDCRYTDTRPVEFVSGNL